jgi:peptide/nickel transport system permease protein
MPRRVTIVLGLAIILLVAGCAVAAPWLAPYDPMATTTVPLDPPSADHWFGTDDLGRDILSRVIYGARVSILIGIGAAAVGTLLGVPLGLAAGYLGGTTDLLATQVINLFIALPGLVLAMILAQILGSSLLNLVFVLGFVSWPGVARLVRGQTLAIRESVFVEAARAVGGGPAWITRHHIWPNVLRLVTVEMSTRVALAIFTSSSLSFLGLGLPPPTPDWGGMVRGGFDYLVLNPSMSLAPGCAVALTVIGFYLLGLRDE